MAAIFLSYSREDRGCAERLARALEQAGHQVWWDGHIRVGGEFAAEIEAALEKADVILVAWSANAANSPWVRDEAAIGRDSGRLLPVQIDGGKPPIGFRQFQSLDLSGWKGHSKDRRTQELLDAVDAHVSRRPRRFIRSEQRFSWNRPLAVWIVAVALLLFVGGSVVLNWKSNDERSSPLSKPKIALLPFTSSSSDPELRELGSQTRDWLARTFSQSGVPLRLVDSVPSGGSPAVDFVMRGNVSRNAGTVVATVRLDEAAHGVTVFSHQFETPQNEIGILPERIGAQMAGKLTWAAPQKMLDRRQPIDPALLADLLQTADFTGDKLQNYQILKRVAGKAPNLQIAKVSVAFNTAWILEAIPRQERREAVIEARRAAERAIALGADYGDIYGAACLLQSETRLADCEARLRVGRKADPDAPFLNTFLSQLLRDVGRFDESVELARLSYTHDPYVPTKIGWMLRMLEYSGERDRALELYEQGVRWWPEFQPRFFRDRLWGLMHQGDLDTIERIEKELGKEDLPPNYVSSGPLVAALRSKSIAAATPTCVKANDLWLMVRCMLVLSKLGDQDRAYAIADKLYPQRVGRTPTETQQIWLDDPSGVAPLEFITSPAAASMRRDPRYLRLAQRVGLVAYWRSSDPPDFCRQKAEAICPRLLKRS